MTLKGTLAKYPGCVHWHFKRDRQPGTLEITLWDREGKVWFPTRPGRTGGWVEDSIERIRQSLEQRLAALGE